MLGTCAGAQVISTVQARVDGGYPSTRIPFPKGSVFRWLGMPLRLDGARAALLLNGAEGQADLRSRVPRTVEKLSRSRGVQTAPLGHIEVDEDPDALIVTDGRTRWTAQVVPVANGEQLLHFPDGVPPANVDLEIAQAPTLPAGQSARKTICFTAGTRIDTPDGPRPVEDLHIGDRVTTRDNGAQDILWIGMRRMSGARMFALPELRPVRLRAGTFGADRDLFVSPGHQVLIQTPAAQTLWSTPEVLVRAQDLVDDRHVLTDHAATDVVYFHILTARHQVLRAHGAWVESFHPGDTDLRHVNRAELSELRDVVPDVDTNAQAYGPHARRCLSAAELAIMRHDGAPRYLA